MSLSAVGLAMAAIGPAADAHSPYLQPTQFAPTRGYVAVLAALTDEVYFVPDFALRGDGFFLVDPEGRRSEIKNVAPMKSFVAAEADLPADGTYRITTGERAGSMRAAAKIFSEAQILPKYDEGEMVGVQVNAIQPGGMFEELGFSEGDVITKLNDIEINSPEESARVLAEFSENTEFTVELDDGTVRTMTLDPEDLE